MPKQTKWLGDKITEDHILEAARLWKTRERTLGFKESAKYDVYIDNEPYPPKAICALAYDLATNIKLTPSDFPGAKDGYWHGILKKWFPIRQKFSDADLEASADRLHELSFDELTKKAEEQSNENPEKVAITTFTYKRSPYVRAAALRRANGECQDCKKGAPFMKQSNGQPYLEVHHVVPLSRSGADSLANTIALCPNCHAKRHDQMGLAQNEE